MRPCQNLIRMIPKAREKGLLFGAFLSIVVAGFSTALF